MTPRSSVARVCLPLLLALALLFGVLAAAPTADAAAGPAGAEDLEEAQATPANAERSKELAAEDEGGTYIVRLTDAPAATYRGGKDGLAPTAVEATGAAQLDADAEPVQAYRAYLRDRTDAVLEGASTEVGRTLEPTFRYELVYGGFAVELSPAEAAELVLQPGVADVQRDEVYQLETDVGPEWIGAPAIYDGDATGGLPGTQGEDIIAGIIDSGVAFDNPSFAATGDDDYTVENPFGEGNYVGVCDDGSDEQAAQDPPFLCNSKLIGAWNFIPDEPLGAIDENEHGSHTGSTTAGNVVEQAVVTAGAESTTVRIQGVAPHANVISYNACDVDGCPVQRPWPRRTRPSRTASTSSTTRSVRPRPRTPTPTLGP